MTARGWIKTRTFFLQKQMKIKIRKGYLFLPFFYTLWYIRILTLVYLPFIYMGAGVVRQPLRSRGCKRLYVE